MNRFLLILLIGLLTSSCSPSSPSKTTEVAVPAALDKNEYASASFSKISRGGSMIDELYQEELDRNERLQELDQRILDHQAMTSDSLEEINTYISNNETFFQEAGQSWIPHLTDSTLRQQEKSQLEVFERKHLERIKSLTIELERLKHKRIEIADHYWQLKLKTVEEMMHQYQLASLPGKQSVLSLIKDQNTILKEIEDLRQE